ncbi:MAG: hypothetical protein WCF04_05920 [Candidatus Nanopelagicales bacterium]
MIEDHTAEIEADLQEVYGVALMDLFTGRLSWRRLLVLLDQLPAGSRLARAQDVRAGWSVTDYLTAHTADTVALVADELAALRWMYQSSHRKKGATAPKKPKPYPRLPRPGEAQRVEAPTPKPDRRAAARALAGKVPVQVVAP